MFIMAVDPGVTTGIASYSYNLKRWQTWQLPFEPIRLYEFWETELKDLSDYATVICETFDYRPEGKYNFGGSRAVPKVDLTAREVIGILKLACDYAGINIVWQKPSIVNGDNGRKTKDPTVFWTDDKVKGLGLFKPGHVHEMDAVKHILHYRAFVKEEQALFRALHPTKITGFEETMI